MKLSVFMSFHSIVHGNIPPHRENQRPLIRLRHLLPHAEKRVGEKDARRTLWSAIHLDGEKSGQTLPSPQSHPLRRREVKLLSRLHTEGLVPLITVAAGLGAVL